MGGRTMNRYGFLSYALMFCLGAFISAIGFNYKTWQFWILLVLIASHGITERLDAFCEVDDE